ncbi:hypothetical protein Clacol_010457 [Clathrus columnatus]|uniref:HMA domain-containing protein n=1 Tax=Clathrus columnatus TaxID=1419009 RepID=A0AAV5AQS5_9AGAM|nr:hypothetical protein Clacol_010457 [Clathrus columnatus]
MRTTSARTILHITNLHCHSCAAEVRACFKLLDVADVDGPDIDLQISLEDRTVSFRNVNVIAVTNILEDAGFDVSIPSTVRSSPWRLFLNTFGHRKAREARHKQTCLACRSQSSEEESIRDEKVPPSSSRDHEQILQSSFTLDGLTCSSCTSTLTNILDPSTCAGVKSSQVKLLPPVAVITHDSNIITTGDIENLISDAGYGAQLIESKPLSQPPTSFKVSFAIDGMTCVSCVNSVTRAMENIPSVPVKSPSVNLLGKSGSVIIQNREHAEVLRQEIEDAGFDCTIIEIVEVEGVSKRKQQRVVSLKFDSAIDRQRLASVLGRLDFHVTSEINQSVVKLTYTPHPPNDTLRAIIKALHLEYTSANFKILSPSDLAPPDSSDNHRILILFLTSLAFAIPMFIVAVIGMSLLPSGNKFRTSLERNIWGDAMLGTIIMWILATPIQIGVGAYFWKGAWKSIRNVWRRRGKNAKATWFARIFMWGSMDTLVAFGTSIGYVASLALLGLQVAGESSGFESVGNMGWFDSSVFLMVFILLGRYLDHVTKQKTTSVLSALSSCVPDSGLLLGSSLTDVPISIPVALLEKSDVILVPAGSSPPLDCTLIPGRASSSSDSSSQPHTTPLAHFTEAALTGESTPVPKYANDTIYAGTINAGPGAVFARIECVEGERMVDSIIGMITGRKSSSMVQKISGGIGKIAEQITAVFVPIIVGIACIVLVGWCWRGNPSSLGGNGNQDVGGKVLFGLQFAVAVLVVACPCGIGLAAPTAQVVGIGIGAQHGIISNGGGEAFSALGNLNTVVVDKTGTITGGKFTVANYAVLPDSENSTPSSSSTQFRLILAILRAAEFTSTHPVAVGVRDWCDSMLKGSEGETVPSIEVVSSDETPGRGLTARLRQSDTGIEFEVAIGNEKLMDDVKAEIPTQARDKLISWKMKGQSIVLLSAKLISGEDCILPIDQTGHTLLGLFGVHDPPRPEASLFISELAKLNVEIWMISGDNEITAKAIAQSVGIETSRVIAGALPGDKQSWVEKLQNGEDISGVAKSEDMSVGARRRRVVAFVGDGINDAPALSQADISFAMGSGSSLALSTASFTILRSNLLSLLTIHNLAKSTRRKILSNFVWACIYNIALIPLAAGAFYGIGGRKVTLPPVWASAAMALSSVSVVTNSLLLRWTYREPSVVRKWDSENRSVEVVV